MKKLIPILIENGLDGLEYSHPDHTLQNKRFLKKIADKYDLLLTGGSDFHSINKEYPLGNKGVSKNTFLEIKRRINE